MNWLKINGEAVYATRPYEVLGEVSEKWTEKDEHGHLKYLALTQYGESSSAIARLINMCKYPKQNERKASGG